MTLSSPAPAREAARITGRAAVTSVFFLNGLTLSTYIVRLASLKQTHHLSDGQLGLLGVLFGLAALSAMQFVGALVARWGSRPILRTSLATMPVLLAGLGLTQGVLPLLIAAGLLGAVHGVTDAAMNAHAVAVERRAGRPILNGCHAAWSLSAVLASLVTVALVHAGVGPQAHLLAAAAVLLPAGVVVGPWLLPATADRSLSAANTPGIPSQRNGWRHGWTRVVVGLGLTGTVLMVCEGAALAWSSVFLHENRHASLAFSASTVTAYTAGQTLGRLVGDRLTTRHGMRRLFRAGALIAVTGLAPAVLSPLPGPAVAGFAVLGLGMSVLLPLTFSAVGQGAGDGPAAAVFVSRFSTFTYAGILLGPGLIGWGAELVGLAWTMAALLPLLIGVGALTRLPDRGESPAPRS